jgi:RNA polymerase sigma-70 factor (ECF subfamily)
MLKTTVQALPEERVIALATSPEFAVPETLDRHEPRRDKLAEFVRLARGHDEAAAEELMERLYPQVLKIVRAHLPKRTSEEDLTQMIFIKVFNNLKQFEGRVPFEHWVTRIAVNTCFTALKAEKARPELRWADFSEEHQIVLENLGAEAVEPQETSAAEAREILQLLMAQLSATERLILTLLHLEEKSVAEVQAMTGWSTPLVKIRAFRARKKLKALLQKMEKGKHEKR